MDRMAATVVVMLIMNVLGRLKGGQTDNILEIIPLKLNFKSLAFKNPEKFWALSIEQQKNSKISRRGRMHGNF